MKRIHAFGLSAILAAGGAALLIGAEEEAVAPLRLIQTIPMPKVVGRIDHFTTDNKRKRLIFSALGNDTVEIVDVFAGKIIATIKGLSQPQGALYIPGLDKIIAASAADHMVRIYNGATFALLATLEFKEDPDNLRYDAATKRVYVGYGDPGSDAGAIGVIDIVNNKKLETKIKLDEHPESFQLETKGPRIFANIARKGYVAVADRNTGVISQISLGKLTSNFPLAFDEESHRLFVVTRKPSRFVAIDTEAGKVVADLPCVGDSDDMWWDAARKRVYVIGGEGFISVFQQQFPDQYSMIAKIPSVIGARVGMFFASRDRLYVGVPSRANLPGELWVYETQE